MEATDPDTAPDPLAGLELTALVGPTAVGKSALALALAQECGAEIVSLDSMQVYRGLDIGTAKPSATERARVPHHMLDLVEPSERYDIQRFLHDLAPVMADLRARGRRALIVGGTGFYLKALSEGLFQGPPVDHELRTRLEQRAREQGPAALHAELLRRDPPAGLRIHPNDVKRVVRALEVHEQTGRPLSHWQRQWGGGPRAPQWLVGLDLPPAQLAQRIGQRARAMLRAGWPAEAAAVRAGCGFGPSAAQALGYAEALQVFDGTLDAEQAAERIAAGTRRFARRQRTWYRKFAITWLPSPAGEPGAELLRAARAALGW